MYLLYLLCITSFAVGADLPLPSTPPQPINGVHYKNVPVYFGRYTSVQELKKDSPLKASQDDNDMLEDITADNITPNNADDDDLIFRMDK